MNLFHETMKILAGIVGMSAATLGAPSVFSATVNSQTNRGIAPGELTCEYLVDPMAVDVARPRLSWINTAEPEDRGQVQTAYRVQVASTLDALLQGKADLWDTGRVASEQSTLLPYAGKALEARQDCWWRVRVWDRDGKASDWSDTAFWGMGLLKPDDWKAQWIGAPWQGEEPMPDSALNDEAQRKQWVHPAPLLRKEFETEKEIASARAFVTGLGYFELYLNGQKVGEDVLIPNQTNYGKRPGLEKHGISVEDNFKEYRVMYLAYDITNLLQEGQNVIGAVVGNGFYDSPSHWTQSYGTPRFLGQLHITYTDGTEAIVVSDESWKAARGPIVFNTIYNGEHYDARLEQPGWSAPGFDDSGWETAAIKQAPEARLKAHMSPPDRVMERLEPVAIEQLGTGHYRVDFGQEISGWLHMSGLNGDAGHRIDIKYLENNAVTAQSGPNSYTLSGEGDESYAARFTWFVFRFAELTNWPGELTADQVVAEAVYTDVPTTGAFECSNELLNTIHQIWWRSQTDNMHGGIASDCPHRERSAYTGDGQVACVTVMHSLGAQAFYTKWIQDILGAQNVNTGYVPNGAPWQPGCGGGVAWGAAISIMPWEFYLHYGDLDMLRYTFDGMKGYIRHMQNWVDDAGIMLSQMPSAENPTYWMNLGDWCAPGELPPTDMVHTFYFWRCADLTAKTAAALGEVAEAEKYAALAEQTRQAFLKKFFNPEKNSYGANGGNIFALKMGVPEAQLSGVIAALKADIAAKDGHLDTGIFGTQFFFETLAENGLNELAYAAINKRTQPSYGWWLEQGATTSWEMWNGENSRNHPMFGGGIVWLYRKLAGMNADPDQPGYKHIVFRPEPVGDVDYAHYSNQTMYGRAGIRWDRQDDLFSMEITVPVGSTATVYVPAKATSRITEGGEAIKANPLISPKGIDGDYAVFNVASGNYRFAVE